MSLKKKKNSLLAASGVERILECQVELLQPGRPPPLVSEVFWRNICDPDFSGNAEAEGRKERMFLAWEITFLQAARCA